MSPSGFTCFSAYEVLGVFTQSHPWCKVAQVVDEVAQLQCRLCLQEVDDAGQLVQVDGVVDELKGHACRLVGDAALWIPSSVERELKSVLLSG